MWSMKTDVEESLLVLYSRDLKEAATYKTASSNFDDFWNFEKRSQAVLELKHEQWQGLVL